MRIWWMSGLCSASLALSVITACGDEFSATDDGNTAGQAAAGEGGESAGGTTSAGGSDNDAGRPNTDGGSDSDGGAPSSGGASSSGGSPSDGGSPGDGGASGSGAASGDGGQAGSSSAGAAGQPTEPDCEALAAEVEEKLGAAQRCLPGGIIPECTETVDGVCCPVLVAQTQSSATGAYLDALDRYRSSCVIRCPDVPCIETTGTCVGKSDDIGMCERAF